MKYIVTGGAGATVVALNSEITRATNAENDISAALIAYKTLNDSVVTD